jgi:plastocyanin
MRDPRHVTLRLMPFLRRSSLLAACLFCAHCGGNPSEPTAPAAATITITTTGVVPKEITVPSGSRVLFVNNDSQSHAMSSDPVQVHNDCPGINAVGTLPPGQSKSTSLLTTVRTCGFHDHTREFEEAWKGRIIVN